MAFFLASRTAVSPHRHGFQVSPIFFYRLTVPYNYALLKRFQNPLPHITDLDFDAWSAELAPPSVPKIKSAFKRLETSFTPTHVFFAKNLFFVDIGTTMWYIYHIVVYKDKSIFHGNSSKTLFDPSMESREEFDLHVLQEK